MRRSPCERCSDPRLPDESLCRICKDLLLMQIQVSLAPLLQTLGLAEKPQVSESGWRR